MRAPGRQWEIGQVCDHGYGGHGGRGTNSTCSVCGAVQLPSPALRIADHPHVASSITGRNVSGATAVENDLVVPQ